MITRRSRVKYLLFSALVVLSCAQNAAGVGPEVDSRLDLLKGNEGETACMLKEKIYKGCSLSPPSTFNATLETPAACTCNRFFFNIWSACSYSVGLNSFPTFEDWNTICSNSGINLVQAQALAEENKWHVVAPKWARIGVPGKKTMDLQRAVLVVTSSWSVLQILLPIMTALIAATLTVLAFHLCHRNQRAQWGSKVRRLVRPIPRVQPVEKGDAWEIEAPIKKPGQYELMPNPGDNHLSDSYAFGLKSPHQLQAQKGVGHTRTDSELSDSGSTWSSLKNLRLPWKSGPKRVQVVHATTEFDLDDFNMSASTVGFAEDTTHTDERFELMSGRPSFVGDGQVPLAQAKSSSSLRSASNYQHDDIYSYNDPFPEGRSHPR